MPDQTNIDLSPLSIDDLNVVLSGLREDLENARTRVSQIEHDIRMVEYELASR